MQLVMSGLGVLIMAGICGLSGFFVIADERHGHGDQTPARDPIAAGDISTRQVDTLPLSLEEVFPDAEIHLVAGAAPYRVGMTHIDTDCNIATTGSLGAVLDDHSCDQVVRASMTAPYGDYRVTAGVFNLGDAVGAAQVGEQVRDLMEAGNGGFAAMASGVPGSDGLAQPLSQAGWRERGHYLVYCVIVRPDGQVVRDDDPYAQRITADLVESYLGEQILGGRTHGSV